MSNFKIIQEVLDRLNTAFETDSAKGMVRLIEIIRNATDDPLVAKSKMALDMIEVMLELLLTNNITTTDQGEALKPLVKAVWSVQSSVYTSGKKRNRPPSAKAGKAFVAAVKKASSRKLAHSALAWLEEHRGEKFDGFDVLETGNGFIRYKFDKADRRIKEETFKTYWQKTKPGKK